MADPTEGGEEGRQYEEFLKSCNWDPKDAPVPWASWLATEQAADKEVQLVEGTKGAPWTKAVCHAICQHVRLWGAGNWALAQEIIGCKDVYCSKYWAGIKDTPIGKAALRDAALIKEREFMLNGKLVGRGEMFQAALLMSGKGPEGAVVPETAKMSVGLSLLGKGQGQGHSKAGPNGSASIVMTPAHQGTTTTFLADGGASYFVAFFVFFSCVFSLTFARTLTGPCEQLKGMELEPAYAGHTSTGTSALIGKGQANVGDGEKVSPN